MSHINTIHLYNIYIYIDILEHPSTVTISMPGASQSLGKSWVDALLESSNDPELPEPTM